MTDDDGVLPLLTAVSLPMQPRGYKVYQNKKPRDVLLEEKQAPQVQNTTLIAVPIHLSPVNPMYTSKNYGSVLVSELRVVACHPLQTKVTRQIGSQSAKYARRTG